MRNRNQDSTSPLDPTDCCTYTVTEEGRRACAAATMQAAAASLRGRASELEEAAERLMQDLPTPPDGACGPPPNGFRHGTVCGRFRHRSRVPDLRLCGKWLGHAGFGLGQKYQVGVGEGRLTISAE